MRSIVSLRLILGGCILSIALTAASVQAADPLDIPPAPPMAGQMPASVTPQPAAPFGAGLQTSPGGAGSGNPRTTWPATTPHVAPRPFIPSRVAAFTPADANATQSRYAPGYFGGSGSRGSLSQLPRRRAIQSAPPQPMRGATKPFETIYREPTISPYLNLEREEDDAQGAPNYHTFVRPYQDQIETNRFQQRELQRLRGQVQGLSTTIATPQRGEASLPATGTRSRYGDTAQFYGAWRR